MTKSFAALLPRGSHFVRQAHHVLLLIKPLKINVFSQRPEPQKRHLGKEFFLAQMNDGEAFASLGNLALFKDYIIRRKNTML